MESNHQTTPVIKCEDCEKLVGAGRHTPAHKNLIQTDYKPVSSMFGSVDEYYYKCAACGETWLHETGSYGQGWV